jgi:hypothetical protein
MEFVSLMALETRNRQLKQRVDRLERENTRISESLRNAEAMLEERKAEAEDEAWPELINDDPAH